MMRPLCIFRGPGDWHGAENQRGWFGVSWCAPGGLQPDACVPSVAGGLGPIPRSGSLPRWTRFHDLAGGQVACLRPEVAETLTTHDVDRRRFDCSLRNSVTADRWKSMTHSHVRARDVVGSCVLELLRGCAARVAWSRNSFAMFKGHSRLEVGTLVGMIVLSPRDVWRASRLAPMSDFCGPGAAPVAGSMKLGLKAGAFADRSGPRNQEGEIGNASRSDYGFSQHTRKAVAPTL